MNKIYPPVWLVVLSAMALCASLAMTVSPTSQSAKPTHLGDLDSLEGVTLAGIHTILGSLAGDPYR